MNLTITNSSNKCELPKNSIRDLFLSHTRNYIDYALNIFNLYSTNAEEIKQIEEDIRSHKLYKYNRDSTCRWIACILASPYLGTIFCINCCCDSYVDSEDCTCGNQHNRYYIKSILGENNGFEIKRNLNLEHSRLLSEERSLFKIVRSLQLTPELISTDLKQFDRVLKQQQAAFDVWFYSEIFNKEKLIAEAKREAEIVNVPIKFKPRNCYRLISSIMTSTRFQYCFDLTFIKRECVDEIVTNDKKRLPQVIINLISEYVIETMEENKDFGDLGNIEKTQAEPSRQILIYE